MDADTHLQYCYDYNYSLIRIPQNYAQQGRESLKNDTKVPDINIKREYLTPCVQKYLSKFFGAQSLAGIEIQRDYLPPLLLAMLWHLQTLAS